MIAFLVTFVLAVAASGPVLDHQKLLERETFWDNRDWDWYKANIPFFECPDADITTTYYYRWEVVTKHLTYGSPNTGYTFTEFIDRPFWSGTYGAISCPAGHQLYEVRWLRDPTIARDYGRYWFRTPGAQPRRYSTWLADALWSVHQVHPDAAHLKELLPDLIKNYEGWEERHFDKDAGLFWQTGHDDGMEININSRQTKDEVRGAPGYRPTLNSYLWADALAIARIAELAGDRATAGAYREKAAGIKRQLQQKLWDPQRQFFFPMAKRDEEKDGHAVKAGTLTYQTGKYAGSPHGRELIGYVPWQFNLPDPGYEAAWKFLMDGERFLADFGPTTVERRDPLFLISPRCCVWSGNSWPYATTQTLKALANVLQNYKTDAVTKADYLRLLQVYARTHRKAGRPYIAEACHPDTGSWDGHDAYNHSEHYFHSGYVDLVITGLVGLRPRDDDKLDVVPLAPQNWDYFALDNLQYRGRTVSIVWDREGKRYSFGQGLHIVVEGKKLASAARLEQLTAELPPALPPVPSRTLVNYAVNNDGQYFPHVRASFTNPKTLLSKLNDGNYWYHPSPPNRWTCEGSSNGRDWCSIDFGMPRPISLVKLYFLDDGERVLPPAGFELESWDGEAWKPITLPNLPLSKGGEKGGPVLGRRATVLRFPTFITQKLRVVFEHDARGKTGLTEIEAWGEATRPVPPAPPPTGNLALNADRKPFPKASASFTSRFDQVHMANDGVMSFHATPHNRWTSYESPNARDWLEIDFGAVKEVGRVELAIYDDRGGVQAPQGYHVQFWDGEAWKDVGDQKKDPAEPTGGQLNEIRFQPVKTAKLRVVFVHKAKTRSGVSEVFVWAK